jgi:hypothetical protein
MSMGEIKQNLFQKDLEKLLNNYNILGAFFQLEDGEQCLCSITANSDGINVKLNDKVIDQDNFKKVIETLYNAYCKQ